MYGIVRKKSITIPGDERSKTHPGHGYPKETLTFNEIELVKDKQLFDILVQKIAVENQLKDYQFFELKELTVERKIEVKIS